MAKESANKRKSGIDVYLTLLNFNVKKVLIKEINRKKIHEKIFSHFF